MELEIIIAGQRVGVLKLEVDLSVVEPYLARLAMFGLKTNPVPPDKSKAKGKK